MMRCLLAAACGTLAFLLPGFALAGPSGSDQTTAGQAQVPPRLERPDQPYLLPPVPPRTAPPVPVRLGAFQSVQVNVDINGNNILGDAANEPSIAVDPGDPNRIVIGWRQFDTVSSNFRQAGWAYSHDEGRTWRFPGKIQAGVFRSDPVLGAHNDGRFVYASLQGNFTVQTFLSETSGVSWLMPGNPAFGGDKQWIAIDNTTSPGAGQVYQAWSTAAGCCGFNTFSRSIDGGVSWDDPIRPPFNPIWGQLSVDPNGDLYLGGIRGDTFGSSSFVVDKSTDAKLGGGPVTFPQSVFVGMGGGIGSSGGPNPGGLLGQLSVATDHSTGPNRGDIYLLASVNPSGPDPLDIHFVRSRDGGVTWSHPVRVNDDPSGTNAWQWFGTMSVAPNGRIDAIWNDTRNDPGGFTSELFYSFSVDGGVTWSPNQPMTPGWNPFLGYPQQNKIGDYYDMVSDDLGANVAFAATFNGEQDVYFLRIGPPDCNGNGVDDASDIAAGTSLDANMDGIPDECQTLILSKFNPGTAGTQNAFHLTRATPNGQAFFLFGTVPASIPVGSCSGAVLGIGDPIVSAPFPTDPTGHVTVSGLIGPGATGLTILIQAFETAPCRLSNTISQTFQ